jgi:hypothetical protein
MVSGAAITSPEAARAGNLYVYYAQSNGAHLEDSFPCRLLKLALQKSGKPYVLLPSPKGDVTESRAMELIDARQGIDVEWVGANQAAEDRLLPVLFPIDGGLLGYRIFLIDGARQVEFSRIRSLSDLQAMTALQGKGWADVKVLRNSRLRVFTAFNRENIYKMLMVGRGDYFPRAAFEAFSEQKKFQGAAPGMTVEKTLALHYPLTLLYYVAKSNVTLRDDIYAGLQRAFQDGSYQKLFMSDPDVRTAIDLGDLSARHIFEIDNPVLPSDVKAIPPRYWYHPR